jgi:hypothetical protein
MRARSAALLGCLTSPRLLASGHHSASPVCPVACTSQVLPVCLLRAPPTGGTHSASRTGGGDRLGAYASNPCYLCVAAALSVSGALTLGRPRRSPAAQAAGVLLGRGDAAKGAVWQLWPPAEPPTPCVPRDYGGFPAKEAMSHLVLLRATPSTTCTAKIPCVAPTASTACTTKDGLDCYSAAWGGGGWGGAPAPLPPVGVALGFFPPPFPKRLCKIILR